MGDLVDSWQQDREQYLAAAIANVSAAAREAPAGSGRCLNCDEPLDPPVVTDGMGREIVRRWCDYDCMTDYQSRERAARMAPTETGLPSDHAPIARCGAYDRADDGALD